MSVELSNEFLSGPYTASFTLRLVTDHVAMFVWLEAAGVSGRFSDNGFLMAEAAREVRFLAKQWVDVEELRESLTVTAYRPCQGERLACL